MKRGEVWTLQDRNYASKARPVVIVQADENPFESVILCLLTTFESENISTRVSLLQNSVSFAQAHAISRLKAVKYAFLRG